MTPQGLTHLRIADLSIALQGSLPALGQPAVLRTLLPFATDAVEVADIVVSEARPSGSLRSGEPGFPLDVERILAPESEGRRATRRYWIDNSEHQTRVVGPLGDLWELVAGIHLGLAHALPRVGGVLLHASAVCGSEGTFVFPGSCGSGKTTAAHGFAGAEVLADDRCVIRRTSTGWLACSIPLSAPMYSCILPAGIRIRLLAFVRKDASLSVVELPASRATTRLLSEAAFVGRGPGDPQRVLDVLAGLVDQVPVVELSYRPGDRFWEALRTVRRNSGRGGTTEGTI